MSRFQIWLRNKRQNSWKFKVSNINKVYLAQAVFRDQALTKHEVKATKVGLVPNYKKL